MGEVESITCSVCKWAPRRTVAHSRLSKVTHLIEYLLYFIQFIKVFFSLKRFLNIHSRQRYVLVCYFLPSVARCWLEHACSTASAIVLFAELDRRWRIVITLFAKLVFPPFCFRVQIRGNKNCADTGLGHPQQPPRFLLFAATMTSTPTNREITAERKIGNGERYWAL